MSALTGGVIRLDDPGLEYRFERTLGVGGVGPDDLARLAPATDAAAAAFAELVETGQIAGFDEPVLWPRLNEGAVNAAALASNRAFAEAKGKEVDAIVSIGIGGSYLGNRVLRDALLGTHANQLTREDRGGPMLFFAGYHLDPAEARQLVEVLRARTKHRKRMKVHLFAISKSGGTTETLATTLALMEALRAIPGLELDATAMTGETSQLAGITGSVQTFPEGIGGRWCVLAPVGLYTAAATGVDVDALLSGARAVREALLGAGGDLSQNPALLYAALHHLHAQQGRMGAVFMPYAERLRCVSEWYVQLLAESLGKEQDRAGNTVHAGRTPIVAVGTTDMHAQTQLHQAGPHDKTVTTLDVADWGAPSVDRVPGSGKLAGKTFAELNTLARVANEEALASAGRPSDALVLDRLGPRTLGGLLYLLMASVVYEGELLNVCAFDQPGVEAYKKIMKARL